MASSHPIVYEFALITPHSYKHTKCTRLQFVPRRHTTPISSVRPHLFPLVLFDGLGTSPTVAKTGPLETAFIHLRCSLTETGSIYFTAIDSSTAISSIVVSGRSSSCCEVGEEWRERGETDVVMGENPGKEVCAVCERSHPKRRLLSVP